MDICKETFYKNVIKIELDIRSASFIAIDTEFTGLLTDSSSKRSYFDSGEKLYEKEKRNLQEVSICQIGLSIFKGSIDENSYNVNSYNFYVRPHSLLSNDENILCQASSLEFLHQNNFDFTRWLVNGLPCLNEEQEEKVREFYSQVLNGFSEGFTPLEVLAELDNVRKWLSEPDDGSELEIKLNSDTDVLLFFSSFLTINLDVLPVYRENKLFVIRQSNVTAGDVRKEAEKALDLIVERSKGFINVFNWIVDSKVPVVFHNGFIDLLLIYKQFYRSLPKRFEDFKSRLHSLFPLVYDTKQLAFFLGLKLRSSETHAKNLTDPFLRKTSLWSVKNDLEREFLVLHRPKVKHSPNTQKYVSTDTFFHEAGYDAFCTGFCFAHLSHIYAMYKVDNVSNQRPLSSRELVHAMRQWVNEVPVQRVGIRHITLDGRNPEVQKFNWLVIEQRNPFKPLNPDTLMASLRPFGVFDVIRRDAKSAIVATPRNSLYQDVIRALGDDMTYRVTRYNAFRHSKPVRTLFWTCAILSTSLSTFLLLKSWSRLKSN